MHHDVLFADALPLAFKEDIERQMFYISEDIDDFSLIIGAHGIGGVRVQVGGNADPMYIEAKIRSARTHYATRRPRLKPDRVWSAQPTYAVREDTFELMRQSGMAHQLSSGLVAVDERFAALADHIDATITAMVKQEFGATEFRYPTLIPLSVMKRGGYLRSFPHLIMFVTRLHCDVDDYEATRQAVNGTAVGDLLRRCQETDLCLPPTMCYHTYQQLADSTLPAASTVVTAKGKSFRFETKYERNLERLWDFTIREVVFIGTAAAVADQRRRLLEAACSLIERWGLSGFCETASDPFFVEDDEKNAFVQKLMSLKYELRLDVRDATTIAVASFNLHNDYIADAYQIRLPDGSIARTACAGFGLERLTYAFLCQRGLDPAGWPDEVRDACARRMAR